MPGSEARREVLGAAQREAAEVRALIEVHTAAGAMRDAKELNDEQLLLNAARMGARVNPTLLPERWAAWVRELRRTIGGYGGGGE